MSKSVNNSQCRKCGYGFAICDSRTYACEYISRTGVSRPAPEDGKCPVFVDKKTIKRGWTAMPSYEWFMNTDERNMNMYESKSTYYS